VAGELYSNTATGQGTTGFRFFVKRSQLSWPLPTPPSPPPIHHLEKQHRHRKRNTSVNSAIVHSAEVSTVAGMNGRVSLDFFLVVAVGQMFTALMAGSYRFLDC
jgi:hypothetical protein